MEGLSLQSLSYRMSLRLRTTGMSITRLRVTTITTIR